MVESNTRIDPVETAGAPHPPEGRSIGLHALAAAVMYVSPLLLFVPAAFISAGLRHGRKGIIGAVFGSAAILLAVAAVFGGPGVSNEDFAGILRMVLTVGLPAAIATDLIRRSVPFGRILVVALFVSLLGFFGAEALMRSGASYSPYGAILTEFRTASEPTIEFYRSMGMSQEQLDVMSRFSETLVSTFVPSVLIVITALMFLFSLVMLPRIPWGRETAPLLLFRTFALPDTMLFAFVLGGVSPLLSGLPRTIGLNVLVVVLFLYLVQGLAVFRAIVLRMKLGAVGSVAAWGLLGMMMLNGIGPFLLFLAGLFDPFFDFRKSRKKGDEDESDSD